MTRTPRKFSVFLERSLWALAVLLFAMRYLFPGDTVFILDEPLFQLRIDRHLQEGTFPWVSFLGSSIHIPYGAGGLWFYFLVRGLSWHPVIVALCHMTLQLGTALLFLRVVYKAYGREACAWVAALVAASPLLFFFARHPWDNTLLMPAAALVLWLLQKLPAAEKELRICLGLGVVVGYALNVHLMFGPMAVSTGLALLLIGHTKYGLRNPKPWLWILLFGGMVLLTLLPYLYHAYLAITQSSRPMDPAARPRWGDLRNLWWLFQRTALYSSLFQANVSFGDLRREFSTFSGSFFAFLFYKDIFGWAGKLAAWAGTLAVLFRLFRGRIDADPLRLLSGLAFFFTLLVYQYLNIPTAPHYFNPVWWLVFVGIAYAIAKMQGIPKRILLCFLTASLFVNVSYIAFATAYIRINRGARNMETSVVVSEQIRIFKQLCGRSKQMRSREIKLKKEAFLSDPAVDFMSAHLPECQGIKIELVHAGANTLIHHPRDSETSAALEITELK